MKKSLLIILSAVLLFSLFFGCAAQNENTQPDSETSVSSAIETKTTEKTTKEETTVSTTEQTTTEESKTEESTTEKSTTKKEGSSKPETTAASTKKQHTQVENFCFITIECNAINETLDKLKDGHAKYVPKDGIIVSKTKCTFNKGATAYDILEKICEIKGIRLTARETAYGVYVSGINNLDEFDCGRESGWTYRVNSALPSKSCDKYEISSGDDIVFRFVCSSTD